MLDPEIIEAEKEWAQLVVANARSILLKNKKIATGALYNSIRYIVNPQGDIKFIFDEQGKWVQSGRRRNSRFPPPGPISNWIKAKGIQGRDKRGRFISRKSLTFLISRGIAKDGIRPLPFMDMAIKAAKKQLASKLKKLAAKSLVKRLKQR
jgi:hypothetical protein